MPINPNIALGVQPIQQTNMLGQVGQMMALKAAQQEMQGNEEMRNLFAGGANFDDPEFQRRGYTANPKAFQELLGKRATTQKTELEAIGKEIELRRDALVNARTNEDYLKWHDGNSQGKVGAFLKSIGANPSRESIIAQLNQPGGLEKLKTESALGATRLAQELYSTKRSQIAAGPGNRQAALAEAEAERKQKELERVRGIVNGGVTSSATAPVTPMGGNTRSNIFVNPSTNVLADQVAPLTATQAPVNSLLNPPAGQSGAAPVANRVDEITRQLTLLSKEVSPGANQAMERLIKELNVINPAGKVDIGKDGVVRIIDERSGVARVVTGTDGQPLMGQVTPVIKSVLDPTDPNGKRMIDVDVNSYVPNTGLGVDGKSPVPKGVIGISASQFQPNYMRDPNNPQGVVPVPGSPADPNAVVPSGYRLTADRKGLESIPGGPADPSVQAKQTSVKLSERDLANREAKYPQATAALKGFEAKTTKFVRDIDELIANEKGLNEITGFLAGRTDLSALSSEGRRALALFNTITAKGGFSELQDMRNSSPTGGALGNVSDREGRQLIDAVGALSRTQNAKDLRTSLGILKTDVLGANERLNDAYELTYEYKNKGRVPALPPGFKAD